MRKGKRERNGQHLMTRDGVRGRLAFGLQAVGGGKEAWTRWVVLALTLEVPTSEQEWGGSGAVREGR